MSSRVWVGVDPGKSGATVVLREDGSVEVSMRHSQCSVADRGAFLRGIRTDIAGAAVEKVSAMPGQGVVSTFKFGESFGEATALLSALEIRWEFVLPRAWQAGLALPSDKTARKRRLKAIAQERWPEHKWVNEDADAPHIAEWARSRGQWSRSVG